MKKLVLLFLLLFAAPAWAAPTFDASNSTTGAGVTSLSFTLTIGGSCTSTLVAPAVAWNSSADAISSVTVGGVGATEIDTADMVDVLRASALYYRIGATGGNTVEVTFAGAVNIASLFASSYCGVNQSTPIGTAAIASGPDVITTIGTSVSSASGELVIDSVMSRIGAASTITVGAGQTQRYNQEGTLTFLHGVSEEAGAGSVTMSWEQDVADYWAIVAVSLKPAAAATAARRRVVVIQ